MTRSPIAAIALFASLSTAACSPVGDIDGPANPESEPLPELEAHGIDIASCTLTEQTTLTCQWADEESLIGEPLDQLQASLAVFVKAQERALPLSNEGGTIVYDLSQTSYEPGARLLFKTELTADWNGEMTQMFYDEYVYEAAEVEAGVSFTTPLEVWSIGILAADRNVVATFAFEGVMAFDTGEMFLEEGQGPMTWTMIVDPSVGVDLLADGNVIIEGAEPGYYQFENAYTATRYGAGSSDTSVPPESTDPIDEEPTPEDPV